MMISFLNIFFNFSTTTHRVIAIMLMLYSLLQLLLCG